MAIDKKRRSTGNVINFAAAKIRLRPAESERLAERRRLKQIIEHELAEEFRELAFYLAFSTDLSADVVIGALLQAKKSRLLKE